MKHDNSRVLRYLYTVAGKANGLVVLLLLLQCALGLTSVGYALLLRDIVDSAVSGSRDSLVHHLLLFAGLILLRLLLHAAVRFFTEYSASTFENRLKDRLFSSLLRQDYGSVSGIHTGEWMNRLTEDISLVAKSMTDILPNLGSMVIRLVAALSTLLVLEPRFCYFLVPGGLLLLIFSFFFRSVMKQLHKHVREKDGALRVFLQEHLSGLLLVRAYAVEAQTQAQGKEKMAAHHRSRMKRNHFHNICNMGFGLVMQGAAFLGACFCGYGILAGSLSYGTFTAVLQLIGQIQSPFANLSGFLPRYYAMLASAERLLEAEQPPGSQHLSPLPLPEMQTFYRDRLQSLGLSHISFSYQGDADTQEVLTDFSAEIPKGSYVAITGASGCGKSTVLKLLMCLYAPQSGSRYVRTQAGNIPLDHSFQRLFAYVPQGNYLMSGTVREILSFSCPEAADDDARLWRALEIACAADFVRALPLGPDTFLGEQGQGLSEGQMQRLSIARAVWSGHPILLLDEATSALDEETERDVLRNLRAVTDHTVFLVTHRPAALEICDQQIVFPH